MTTGYATATDGLTSDQFEAQWARNMEQAQERRGRIERARSAITTGHVDGLPSGAVEEVRALLDARQRAAAAYNAKDKEVRRTIAEQGISSAAAMESMYQQGIGPAWAAFVKADEQVEPALDRFGRIVDAIRQARATLANLPQQCQAEEVRHQRQQAQFDQDEQIARAVLLQHGVM